MLLHKALDKMLRESPTAKKLLLQRPVGRWLLPRGPQGLRKKGWGLETNGQEVKKKGREVKKKSAGVKKIGFGGWKNKIVGG